MSGEAFTLCQPASRHYWGMAANRGLIFTAIQSFQFEICPGGISFYAPPAFLSQIPGSERVSGRALRFHNCSFCSQPSATGRNPRSGCALLARSFIPGWTGFLLEQLGRCKTPQRTVDLASATTKGKHPKHIFKMNETWSCDVVAELGPMNLCKWELLIASRHIDPRLLQGRLLDCFFTTSWVSFFSMNEACRWQMTLPCQLIPLFWTLFFYFEHWIQWWVIVLKLVAFC